MRQTAPLPRLCSTLLAHIVSSEEVTPLSVHWLQQDTTCSGHVVLTSSHQTVLCGLLIQDTTDYSAGNNAPLKTDNLRTGY